MKKLLLSVAILVGATLVLTQDKSEDLNKVTTEDVVNVQAQLQAES